MNWCLAVSVLFLVQLATHFPSADSNAAAWEAIEDKVEQHLRYKREASARHRHRHRHRHYQQQLVTDMELLKNDFLQAEHIIRGILH